MWELSDIDMHVDIHVDTKNNFKFFYKILNFIVCILMIIFFLRYVRHLDSTVHAIQIKIKLCQLVEAMMLRRDDLTFRQEMKFRNKLVEYLTDWIMGNSHQVNIGDICSMSRYGSIQCLIVLLPIRTLFM